LPPKLDLKKTFKTYYHTGKAPELIVFGDVSYLTINGQGEPAGKAFTAAVEAMYPLAYGIKKVCKSMEMDFGVPCLEGLWWVEGNTPALEVSRSQWFWKLLIRMPKFVSSEMMLSAQRDVAKKKKNDLILEITHETLTEGKCVQIMHIGSYATEPETINQLMGFIASNGLSISGLHHEIYLSDPRKTEPSKMKTLIRYPVE